MSLRQLFDAIDNDPFFKFPAFRNDKQWKVNMKSSVGACNITEDEKNYIFSFQVPGFTKENIDMEIKDNILTVSGNMKYEKEDSNVKYHRREIHSESFSRSFSLPENIDINKRSAGLENGILKLVFGKMSDEESKKTTKITFE